MGRAEVGARRTCRGRRHASRQGAGGPRQSLGSVRVPAGLAQLFDPRHQQTLRRGHALESRLHAPVPGRHRRVLRFDPDRHEGHRRQPTVPVRLARRHAVLSGLCRDGRRFARLGQEPQAPARQSPGSQIAAEESRRTTSDIDWQRVGDLAHSPRAVPVPVTGGHDGLDAVLAQSVLVENTLPEGSNWDGKSGLLVDEKTFNDLVSGRVSAPPVSQSPAAAQ